VPSKTKTLSHEALAVLADGIVVDGRAVRITAQLDRKLYLQVNEALEAIGGKWNRGSKAHLFESDPQDALDQVTSDGVFHKTKQELDQFFTPAALAKRVVEMADVAGKRVLEPSAGDGALVQAAVGGGASDVLAVEVDAQHLAKLHELARARPRVRPQHMDFLEMGSTQTGLFDRVVMNPPFSRQRDIKHVLHALAFLEPGGKLVAIMSAGVKFRQDRLAKAFRGIVSDSKGVITDLPQDSFKESGTGVNTVLVVMTRVA
jgi:predicted RNA methylase